MVKFRIIWPENREISEGLKDLLIKILDKNPESRITAAEIRKHPFILSK